MTTKIDPGFEALLKKCEALGGGAELLCPKLRRAIRAGDANGAAHMAFCLGQMFDGWRTMRAVVREAKRGLKAKEKRSSDAEARRQAIREQYDALTKEQPALGKMAIYRRIAGAVGCRPSTVRRALSSGESAHD